MVVIMPADAPATNGAMPAADMLLTTYLGTFFFSSVLEPDPSIYISMALCKTAVTPVR